MKSEELQERQKEFYSHIWNHAEDPFQVSFDEREPLTTNDHDFLRRILEAVHTIGDEKKLGHELFKLINKSPDRLVLILQMCGLTRNKIITDLKPAYPKFPTAYKALVTQETAWEAAGPYLAKKIKKIMRPLPKEYQTGILESLNQATWPGFIRQERAKRSGHQGEYRLAILLKDCRIPFQPESKAENPICPDVQIHGVSFDVIVPGIHKPKVCVKATIHTANIGQYGESKDALEIDEAKRILDSKYDKDSRPILLALVDGIGLTTNRAGLEGVLSNADEFCQFQTLWKAVVVCSSAIKNPLHIELATETIKEQKHFLERYQYMKYVIPKSEGATAKSKVAAGEGTILLDVSTS